MNSKIAFPTTSLPFSPPKNYIEEDAKLFDFKKEIALPEMKAINLKGAWVMDDGGVIHNGTVLKESLRLPKEMMVHYRWDLLTKRKIFLKKLKGDQQESYININDYWSGEYYHFLIEALQRLSICEDSLENHTLILSERHKKPFIEKALDSFNIKKVIYLNQKNMIYCPNLLLPTFPGPPDWHRPQLLKKIHKKLTSKNSPEKIPHRKIFLSREKAESRRILNRKEVMAFLKEFQFEIICAENLSFEEQVKTFFETSHLVTPHGAGLTNTIFMQPGTHVFEIRKDHYGPLEDKERPSLYQNTYWQICNALNINYYYLKAQADKPNAYYRDSDLTLNISELEKVKAYFKN